MQEKPPKPREKCINKDELELEDNLRPEYDLTSLKVRKMGVGRKNFAGTTVRLEPDVAEMFPNAEAAKEALRFLIRSTQLVAEEQKI